MCEIHHPYSLPDSHRHLQERHQQAQLELARLKNHLQNTLSYLQAVGHASPQAALQHAIAEIEAALK